jgi:LmbE family N-acetylglucosaminyl deacetylase
MKRLIIAPHGDDEVLGVGGTAAKYAAHGDEIVICNVTIGQPPVFSDEAARATIKQLEPARKLLGVDHTVYLNFPAVMLDTIPRYKLNEALIKLISDESPRVVYIPHFADVNADHRMVADACMVALRPRGDYCVREIYSYETLSSSEWSAPCAANSFIPTVWEDITDYLDLKIKAMSIITTQLHPYPNSRSLEAIRALAMLAGRR